MQPGPEVTVFSISLTKASAAASSGVDVGKTFLAVAYGASCAFILPFAHQCNLMVMGPGGYRFADYVKLGVPLTLLRLTPDTEFAVIEMGAGKPGDIAWLRERLTN